MTLIKLQLPDDLAVELAKVTPSAEDFIISLLRSRLGRSQAALSLAEQYQLSAIGNVKINQEFDKVDIAGWEDDY